MIKYLQIPTCHLGEFISESDTTFTVKGFLYNDGITPVAPANIGDICFATLEPKTAREELISFTITNVTAEGIATITATRGLLQKSPYGVGGATFDHQNGSDFVISNNPGLFNQLTAKDNPEVITEQWTFPEPTANNSPATKAYVDASMSLGGPEATDLTRGMAKLSDSPQVILGPATISIATPGVVSFVAHGLVAGDSIKFTTTGALPTGITAGNTYFVSATDLTANTFKISATLGGAVINTSGSQSGVHTLSKWTPVAVLSTPTVSQFIAAMTGMILPFAGDTAPSGFLNCDGASYDNDTYATLAALVKGRFGYGTGVTFTVAVSDVCTAISHGLSDGDIIFFTTSNTLPAGLSLNTPYYVRDSTGNTFKVSTTSGGSAIDITDTGTGTHYFHIQFKVPDLRWAFPVGKGERKLGTYTINSTDISSVSLGGSFSMSGTLDSIDLGVSDIATGEQVVFSASQGGITANTIYYAIYTGSGTTYRLATSYANALANTYIDLSNATLSGNAYRGALFTISTLHQDVADGDTVVLTTSGSLPANIPAGTYYLKKVNTTTFRLADTKAKAIAGATLVVSSTGTGVGSGSSTVDVTSQTQLSVGSIGGEVTHKLTIPELPAHTHSGVNYPGGSADILDSGSNNATLGQTGSVGNDTPHNNMPPYVAVSYIIKT